MYVAANASYSYSDYGYQVGRVVRWDGAAWEALGASVGGTVRALAFDDARGLYVGGEFRSAGGRAAAHIALWDGAAWSALGEGTDGTVSVLQRDGPNGLLVGGRFGRAGTLASPFVARWTATPVAAEAPVPAARLALTVVPNPARGSAVALVTHPAGPVTVGVFDSRRRLVESAAGGEAPGGDRAVPLRLDGLAPGVYVVRLRAGDRTLSRVLVVAR